MECDYDHDNDNLVKSVRESETWWKVEDMILKMWSYVDYSIFFKPHLFFNWHRANVNIYLRS